MEEGLKDDTFSSEQRKRLLLVAQVKAFGEKYLGLKKTQNYQKVCLKSRQNPIYIISASPKDRLVRTTWWFPVVGRMPYLGFFDLESAKEKKERPIKKDLGVTLAVADAYSTLGWFKDFVTLNLLEGSTVRLVETILHEMTHTTLYVKGQGEFNEGLANLVGKFGAVLFFQKVYGPFHPFTLETQKSLRTKDHSRPFSVLPHAKARDPLWVP